MKQPITGLIFVSAAIALVRGTGLASWTQDIRPMMPDRLVQIAADDHNARGYGLVGALGTLEATLSSR